ncbi:MAG: diaminopimelate decarboxylase [Pirellulales bacterium]|nr:diaminopimelate decarboxylase [Pirellulales bacterium]
MNQAATFSTVRTEIAGISVLDLASTFETPTYVYDARKILKRIEELRQFDVIRYAQKACSNLAILDLVRRHGVVVDAVSSGEIYRAQAAGFAATGTPPPIVFCADLFDRKALEQVIALDIHVNVGSADMIEQLGESGGPRNISLRINPGFGHGHSQKTNTGGEQSKHGIWHDELESCLALAQRHDLTVTGLHMHIGSGSDFEHLAQVCGAMEQCAQVVGSSLTSISAGGGLPIPYRDGEASLDIGRYFELWDATRKRLVAAFDHPVSLEIEPGRYLSAEAGYLITEIRAIKKMGANTFYLVDAGFNDLARPIMYGAYHPISLTPKDGNSQRPSQPVVVGGPLCESGDIFTQEEGGFVCTRELPVANVGDFLVIECAGAYGFVMASNYNSRPLAAEVLLQDQQAHQVRRRQSEADLISHEQIPAD